MSHAIIPLRQRPDLQDAAADWFHQKWGVSREAYFTCMAAGFSGAPVPQWYLAVDGDAILGGCGVIENSFPNQPEPAPHLCALYVEESHRGKGLAGELLRTACEDMAAKGVRTLYLLTDREGFYERYGWQYVCPAPESGEQAPTRIYRHYQPLTLHGTAAAPAQFQRLFRRRQASRWLAAAAWTLLVILGFAAIGIGSYSGGGLQGTVLLALLTALGLGVFAGCRAASRRRREEVDAWRCYQAAVAGGVTTRFYPDRVEQRSSRWGETVLLDGAARCTEYADLLLLERGDRTLFLRGEDLTPAEGEAAKAHLRAALPPENLYLAAGFAGTRQQSAPPPFEAPSPFCFEQVAAAAHPAPVDRAGITAAAGAVCLVCAALFTAMYTVTGSYGLDFLLVLAALFGGATLFLLLFGRLLDRRGATSASVTLFFTGEGLGVEQNGAHRLVPPAQVHARRTDNGARLITPAGEFTFAWTEVKNRQQLEWMLFR